MTLSVMGVRRLSRPIERHTLLYLLVSVLDVLFTYSLLYGERSMVFMESNPVARFFLQQSGFSGMVMFKVALVAVVAVNSQIIARTRPVAALWLMRFAGCSVGSVVAWSAYLLWRYA